MRVTVGSYDVQARLEEGKTHLGVGAPLKNACGRHLPVARSGS